MGLKGIPYPHQSVVQAKKQEFGVQDQRFLGMNDKIEGERQQVYKQFVHLVSLVGVILLVRKLRCAELLVRISAMIIGSIDVGPC